MTDNHPIPAPDPRVPTAGLRLPAALIFDMDGVLVDSNPFHLRKWVNLLNEHGIPFNSEELPKQILGHRNDDLLRHFFGSNLTAEERRALTEELEEKFRVAFKPHAQPLPGLRELIAQASQAGIAMAVASSAMRKNVEFVVDALGLHAHFRCLLNGDEVTHAKPDPEIYLKAAEKLGLDPGQCVAFEDSFVGIEAAKNAGMKCVAIGSSFPLEDLRRTRADRVVLSFLELDLEGLGTLDWGVGSRE
ncbi:MAG TPA: HAD family phosphatase [Terriglobia bacterium]|nr:HAD family phosphatase [Terriglobia bacterium]